MRNRLFALILSAMLLLTSACAVAEAPAESPVPGAAAKTSSAAAEPAPTDEVPVLGLFEGTILDPALYEGKAIFLNFFTAWCPYCMEEMPIIRKLYDDYDPEQVAIVLVHVWDGETDAATEKVVKDYGLEGMTILEDSDFALAQFVGIPGYPASLFIDKGGYFYKGVPNAITYKQVASYFDAMGVGKRP